MILTLFYFSLNLKITKKPLFCLELAVFGSMTLKLYYLLSNNSNLLMFAFELILKIIVLIFFYKFFIVFKNKFLFFKFSNIDYLYFSLICLFLSVGIYSFQLEKIYLEYFMLSTIIMLSCKILPPDKFFVFVLSIAIGADIAVGCDSFILFSSIMSILIINVKNRHKILFAATSVISILLYVLLLEKFDSISIYISFVAIIIFLFIPTRKFEKFSKLFELDSLNLMFDSLRREKSLILKNKLSLMSNTLQQMKNNLKFLIVGKISRDKACVELSQDIINACCKNCENYRTCFLENINKKMMFERLLEKAIENHGITIDDVAMGIQSYCNKQNIIVSETNKISSSFLKFEKSIKIENSSKLIISDELGNFADIFKNFSRLVDIDFKFNKNQSLILKEYLLNNMIDTKEVVIVENDNGIESINIIAKNEHLLKREIVDVISKFIKTRVKLSNISHLNYSGLGFASFIKSEKLKLNIAVSSKSKEKLNGDNITMKKLSENKYFIAIADGMGHGENASYISSMTLSLIQSMFEIGFEHELVIQSINKLIIPAGIEKFSSIDACIIDLEQEIVTFIKMGASVSVIKHLNKSETVYCSSLPIGMIENIKPTIIQKNLNIGDIIFLASDGIVDSFSNIDNYKNYINDSKIFNLQKFTDDILFDAEFQNKKHPDDMTIIAINLLKN